MIPKPPICTRAAMMANGRLVAQDRVEALLAPTGVLRIESPDASVAANVLRSRPAEQITDAGGLIAPIAPPLPSLGLPAPVALDAVPAAVAPTDGDGNG